VLFPIDVVLVDVGGNTLCAWDSLLCEEDAFSNALWGIGELSSKCEA
jgi:hypothetical protein